MGPGDPASSVVFQGDPVFHGSGLRLADQSRRYHAVLHFGWEEFLCKEAKVSR